MYRIAFFILFLFLLLTFTVFFRKQRFGSRTGLTNAPTMNAAHVAPSSLQPSTVAGKLALAKAGAMNAADLTSAPTSTFTNVSISGVADRLSYSREMVEQRYRDSPARDTPECQAILKILKENGYGLEYLEPVYILTDLAHILRDENLMLPNRKLRYNGQDYDPLNLEHARLLKRSRNFHLEHSRFKLGQLLQPSANREVILDEILKIEPKAPYVNISAGRRGNGFESNELTE